MSRAAVLAIALAIAAPVALTAASGAAAQGEDAARQAKGPQSRVIQLGLRRDGQGLAQFANQASNPGTPTYRQFLDLGQLKDRFGAAAKARKRAKRFLRRASGVGKVELSSTGAVLIATMSEGASKRLFCAKGASPPQKGLCVPGKLDNAVRQVVAGELFSKKSSRAPAPGARAASGTPQGCADALAIGAFTPNQVATAYGTDALAARGLRGQGMRAAILSSSAIDESAFATWAQCFGLPTPAYEQVSMPSGVTDTSSAPDETYLDVEALSAIAPELDRITAVFVPLDQAFQPSLPLFLFGALDPGRQGGSVPDVLSISDGVCESQFSGDQRRLTQHFLAAAAALGVTVAAASGDLGFLGCQENATGPGYPASSKWVTGVGGTDLTLDAQNQIAAQPVWSTFGDGSGDTTGSGGGPSVEFGRPGWQAGPGIDAALEPTGDKRLSPDVASNASFTPGIVTFGGEGGWNGGGGTSAATPLVAAMLALVAQQEREAGRPPLGSVNPFLYELARGSQYGTVFSDVVVGTSSPRPDTPLGQSPAGGAAQPGYDLATGLGSLRAGPFAEAVAAD